MALENPSPYEDEEQEMSKAEYAAENYGHFGLNLRRYAHFTSPIRRYADLIVLEKNPLDDIRNTRTIHAVYIGGVKVVKAILENQPISLVR